MNTVDKAPGYDQMKRIRRELPALPRRVRTAFAAACAERTLPVVQKYFGTTEVCDRALAVVWRFVDGEDIESSEVDARYDEIDAMVDELYDAEQVGYNLSALKAILYVLQSTISPESETAEDGAIEAQGAADLGAMKLGDAYVQEEADWQMLALDLVLKTREASREQFATLPTDSTWLRALRAMD